MKRYVGWVGVIALTLVVAWPQITTEPAARCIFMNYSGLGSATAPPDLPVVVCAGSYELFTGWPNLVVQQRDGQWRGARLGERLMEPPGRLGLAVALLIGVGIAWAV